jgi:hypothetical protein
MFVVTELSGIESRRELPLNPIKFFAEVLKPIIKKIIINVNKLFD